MNLRCGIATIMANAQRRRLCAELSHATDALDRLSVRLWPATVARGRRAGAGGPAAASLALARVRPRWRSVHGALGRRLVRVSAAGVPGETRTARAPFGRRQQRSGATAGKSQGRLVAPA